MSEGRRKGEEAGREAEKTTSIFLTRSCLWRPLLGGLSFLYLEGMRDGKGGERGRWW